MRCWFSSSVNVEARMEKHCRTRAAVSSMDCWLSADLHLSWRRNLGLKFRLDDGEDGCGGLVSGVTD